MRRQEDCEEYRVKADILPFNNNLFIEEFLNWLSKVELFFDLIEISPNKMVKLAAYKLKVEQLLGVTRCSEQKPDKDGNLFYQGG